MITSEYAKKALDRQSIVFRYAPWCAETRWALMFVQDLREIFDIANDHADMDGGESTDFLYLHVPEFAVRIAAEQAHAICDTLLSRWKKRRPPFCDAYDRVCEVV